MTTLTTIQSIADGVDTAIDTLVPILGIFLPYTEDVKLAADGIDQIIDIGIGMAQAWNSDSANKNGAAAALASLQASKAQLATALSDAQALAKAAGANYPGQPPNG